MSSITGYWIPNVDAVELPGTRHYHFENSRNENATVQVRLLESQIAEARFYGLRNGGVTHPRASTFHLKSIDVDHAIPKEYAGNTGAYYDDECVYATLNYAEWQIENQGYDSVLENVAQTYAVPLHGLFWSMPTVSTANFSDPLWGSAPMYLRRGNLRITRTYSGFMNSPLYIQAYHNTINDLPLDIPEWGMTIAPEVGLFTVGNFQRHKTRDFTNPDPTALIDLYSFSYSIEIMQGTWNALTHPVFGVLSPVYDRTGVKVSFYPKASWNLTSLIP